MKKQGLALVLAGAFTAAGCATVDPQTGQRDVNRSATGALIGAAVGAAAGATAGGDDRRNAIIGAGVGAVAGAAVGAYMDEQERKLREQMANTGVEVVRTAENEITLNMPSDITFDFDRSEVRQEFLPTLRGLADSLRQYPSTTIDVFGHADSKGTEEYNLGLSLRRAESVAGQLISSGVQRERIFAKGFGETAPIADNATDAGRAKNRRVEIKLRAVQA